MQYLKYCDYARSAYEMRLSLDSSAKPLEVNELFVDPVCCDLSTTHSAYISLIEWIKSGGKENDPILHDSITCMWMLCVADFVCAKKTHLDTLSRVFAQLHLPFHIHND